MAMPVPFEEYDLPPKGPSKISKLIKKIKDKLEVIKKINEDPKNQIKDFDGDGPLLKKGKEKYNKYKEKKVKEAKDKLDELKTKNAKKNKGKKNIFGEILDLVSVFLVKKQTTVTPPKWIQDPKGSKFDQKNVFAKDRLEYLAHEAVDKTIKSSKNIVNDNVKKILFAGDGICGSSTLISVDSITLSPKEFDMMNILTISPTSNTGQIVYEPLFPARNLIKMNRTLYSGFTTPQSVESADGKKLFSLNWDEANQYFNVTGLTGTGITVNNFISNYYSNIEQLDLAAVSKTAMLMVLKGDGSEPPLFDEAMNDFNRLINKLMKVCNNPNTINKSTENQFNEDDEDIEFYFDFDDVEGIDLDDESDRLNKVLRFTDCNNFTIPSNPDHFEDFIYLSKSNLNEAIDNSFTNISLTSYQEAGGAIPQINFKLSLLNSYILNLPKALLGCIMSPKYILPIVIIYKITTGVSFTVKEIMKKLYKLFHGIINDILWKFISEFWKLVKKDLLDFLKITAYNLLKEKYKKYRDYILSIMNLIKRLLNSNLGDCNTLFTVINTTIDTALRGGPNLQVPGVINSYAKGKAGFSNLRTLMGVVEQCGKEGFEVAAPVFGQENHLFTVLRATIQQQTKETNDNSYTHVANETVIIPVVAGQVIIPAGTIKSYGGMA
jgi:hypothetical protein